MDALLLSEMIGHLYDAASDPAQWSGMAARIAAAFNSTSTVIKLHGGETPFHLVESTANLVVPQRLENWAERWHRHDLWVERSVDFGMSRIVTDEMLVTPEEQHRSGFYREWLGYLEIHHMVGAVFPAGAAAIGVLGIHRPREAGAYTEQDQHNVGLLLPHLQRSLKLSQLFADSELARSLSLDTLDRLETGVIVAEATGRLVHANAEAERILRVDTGLSVRAGRLLAADPPSQDRLLALLRSATETAAGRAMAVPPALAIPRAGRLPLTLAAAPLNVGRSLPVAERRPLALVFMRDPERPALRVDYLSSLFGMTPTEAAIAAELGAGRGLEEIAQRLKIGLSTVRWHMKSILAKTGTKRQAEATALLARSVAALPAQR